MRPLVKDSEIEKFSKWLTSRGCEILPLTNSYEVLRFRGKEVGVFYTTGKTNSPYATHALYCYRTGSGWNGQPVSTGRHPGYTREKTTLLERDGDCCFFCGLPLEEDITVEHLIPLTAGGTNLLSNMVLAHQLCNQHAGAMPLVEKVKMAIHNRGQLPPEDLFL